MHGTTAGVKSPCSAQSDAGEVHLRLHTGHGRCRRCGVSGQMPMGGVDAASRPGAELAGVEGGVAGVAQRCAHAQCRVVLYVVCSVQRVRSHTHDCCVCTVGVCLHALGGASCKDTCIVCTPVLCCAMCASGRLPLFHGAGFNAGRWHRCCGLMGSMMLMMCWLQC